MKIPGQPYRAQWGQRTCMVRVDGDATGAIVYYPRNTKLGRFLLSNPDGEPRHHVAFFLRKAMGWPSGRNNATPISFVAV